MSTSDPTYSGADITNDNLCLVLESILEGTARTQILDRALSGGDFEVGVKRLRSSMQTHIFRASADVFSLSQMIEELDKQTREDGFHVLQAWDFGAHQFSEENVPTLMMDFWTKTAPEARLERSSLAILLDYYFLHVLALCAMRAWDGSNADATLDRITKLVEHLQGPEGSGHQFVQNAETLLVLAVSHFHPEGQAYDRLVEKVQSLDSRHQLNFALIGAAVLGSHLRWGFSVMYRRDLGRMRDDNTADYPWLLDVLLTLVREYARMHEEGIEGPERENVVNALLNGLSPDPWAFIDTRPAALIDYEAEYSELSEFFIQYREEILEDFESHRPGRDTYSPISFHTNFLPNTLVAMVMTALLEGSAQKLSLNALFLSNRDEIGDERANLARMLMHYANASPDRLGEHGAALIIYDEGTGISHVSLTLSAFRKYIPG